MNVSKRIIILCTFIAISLGVAVSLFAQRYRYHISEQHFILLIGLILLLIIIATAQKLFYYQQSLNRTKNNLNEAQQLAGIGSWERDIVTGKGYWSDNLYRLFNLTPRPLAPTLEEFFLMIYPEDQLRAHETVMEAIRSGSSYEMKYRLAGDADGRIFLNRGKVLHDSDGKPVTLIGSIQDITRKERRIQFSEELLKEKNLLISRLGHDLKTPLTPLVALLPLIRSRMEDVRQLELIDLCINNVKHINDMVTDTIQLARLSSSEYIPAKFTDVQLSSVVESAISSLAEVIMRHHLVIKHSVPSDIIIRGNRTELEELFRQLLSNAAKFSPSGSSITIGATGDNEMTAIVVQDNGIGLSKEELLNVFDDFYKADPSRHELGSSGLGLTICRRIVENHGGQISASSPGRGAGTAIRFSLKTGGDV